MSSKCAIVVSTPERGHKDNKENQMTTTELTTKIETTLRNNTKPGYYDKMNANDKNIYIEYAIREIEKTGFMTIAPTFHLGTDGNRVIAIA